jgi:hypothetical protein
MTGSSPDEAWGFEWGTADGNGGFVRLSFHRSERCAWFWAYLLRPGTGPVVVRDHEVTLPRGRALEIRADSLWSELVCETPGEHWSIGLEAFGVALDDPDDALHGEIGERVALGFDFEWETSGDSYASELAGVAYDEQPGVVHGEVLLGRDRIPLDVAGWFQHSVGPIDRPSDERVRATIAWDDGSWWSYRREICVQWTDGVATPLADAQVQFDARPGALIVMGDWRNERSLGAARSGERTGTAWIERVAPSRAKIT